MVLVIDNYDSFTYNLVQYLGELGADVQVMRNDVVSVDDVVQAKPDRIVISPGPGRPENAGVSMEVIRRLGETTPILGVCLGHQAIGVVYGGTVCRAQAPMLTSAIVPGIILALPRFFGVSVDAAIGAALIASLAQLFLWGLAVGRAAHASAGLALLAALVDCGIGIGIVLLKVLILH
jgi:hypothetical protein